MEYGICQLSLIPQRAEPSEKSEMVNQLLFGDIFSVVEAHKNWLKIKIEYDGYEGWVDTKMVIGIDKKQYLQSCKSETPVVAWLTKLRNSKDNTELLLSPGSQLNYHIETPFEILDTFSSPGNIDSLTLEKDLKAITGQFLRVPYLWGGKSIFGIDCSGLVQVVYKIFGVKLPRDASQQSLIGETVGFVQEAKPGDLAFFDNEEGNITHVGILLDNGKIIHASGFVRIDRIDAHGIYNESTNSYSHKLRLIKRLQNKPIG